MLMNDTNPDIVAVTESWLHGSVDNSVFALSSYKIFRHDRSNGNDAHGGVLLLIKAYLNPILEQHDTDMEVLTVRILENELALKIILAYRRPSTSSHDNEVFINFLRSKLESCNKYVLMGDFNFPGIDWENETASSSDENLFLDFVNENSLTQSVRHPTRGNNVLDLCLATDEDLVREVEVMEPFSTSDHCYFTGKIFIQNPEETIKFYHNFNLADWDSIRSYLSCVDWQDILQNRDTESMWNSIKSIITCAVDRHVPIFQVANRTPWMNSFLKGLLDQKKRKWRNFKNNQTVRNKREFNYISKKVKLDVARAKADFEKRKFLNKAVEPKLFFSYIDKATNSKSDSTIPPLHTTNNCIITSNNKKADILSEQYQSVFTVDDGNFPECSLVMPRDSFTSILISDRDILNAINVLNVNGSPGQDNIYPEFIKKMCCFLVLPLRLLFQKSIDTGILPEDWRKGVVVPIYKKNNKPSEPASYRPICLNSVVCKILEKIVHSYMINYLLENELISKQQHGFLKRRSTTSNLLEAINDWTQYLDNKIPLDIIYIDLAKAFDTVSHEKLIYKLRLLGIGGNMLSWFTSFLTGRIQCVRVSNNFSSPYLVTSGIGQGTILGPLLFILYVNDVVDCIAPETKIQMYADDAKIYRPIRTVSDNDSLQQDLKSLTNFFNSWQLKMNNDKCNVIHLGHNNQEFSYKIEDDALDAKEHCRDLGVIVSKDLSLHKHCMQIAKSAYFRAKQIRIAFECKEIDFRLFLFKTYVRPILESNTQIWSPYQIRDINHIGNVQRHFTKRLPGLWNVPYIERMRRLELKSLETRRIINDIILFYKIIHQLIDVDLNQFFTLNSNSTRGHQYKVNMQYARLNCRKFSFICRTIPKWNNLSSNIVEAENILTFKRMLEEVNFTMHCRGRAHMAD